MVDHRDLRLTKKNLDIFYPLSKKVQIISAIAQKYFKGSLLDIGCGVMPYRNLIFDKAEIDNYDGLDIENPGYQKEIKPDMFWDGITIPSEDSRYDCSMLVEVLEHLPKPEIVLNETHRILKKDGIIFITIPFLWTLHDVPYDECRYTPFALRRLLEAANFEVLEMEALGGWNSSMALSLALYSRRHLRGRKKKIVSFLLRPIIKHLNKLDESADHKVFREGLMITGLWCVAKAIK